MSTCRKDVASAYVKVRDGLLASVNGRTREGYKYDLRAWERYCATLGIDPLGADRRIIQGWVGWMKDRGLGARTINVRLSRVHIVYQTAYMDKVIADDPTINLQYVRCPRPAPRLWLGPHDLSVLLEASRSDPDPTVGALIHLWGMSGLRTSETLNINISSLTAYDGRMVVVLNRAKATCRQVLALPAETAEMIKVARGSRKMGPLFLSQWGQRMKPAGARNRLRHLTDSLGLPPVTPQGLRVTFITLSLAAGIPEREVSIAAGHASSVQTAAYDMARTAVESVVGVKLAAWLAQQASTAA